MTTFLRHRALARHRPAARADPRHRRRLPGRRHRVAQVAFPAQANGSLVVTPTAGRSARASSARRSASPVLLGPAVGRRCDRREPVGYDGMSSAGSNLGPTSQDADRPDRSRRRARSAPSNGDAPIPVDLVTTSASGLDPHISPAAAEYQVARVARRAGSRRTTVRAAVATPHRTAAPGFLGKPRVNVLLAEPRPGRAPAMTDPERDAFDVRPTADEMLARVRAETPSERGRLRVYLGMAPGVGKTYQMLEEGHRRIGSRHRPRRRLRRGPRPAAHRGAARRPRDRAAPPDRVPRRRRRGDGHRRRDRPASRRSP